MRLFFGVVGRWRGTWSGLAGGEASERAGMDDAGGGG